jgi:prepilin-type N-terminal cleavage/methylation domain-containing protein
MHKTGKKGFTLIELLVVIAILVVLAAIAVPSVSGIIHLAHQSADETNLKTLNKVTALYKATQSSQDAFLDTNQTSNDLMGVLIDNGFLSMELIPDQQDTEFKWDFDRSAWFLSDHAAVTDIVYTPSEYFIFKSSTKSITGYDGKGGTDMVIPSEIDGTPVLQIGQSAMYQGYKTNTWDALTSVIFPDTLQTIAGNAFQNNALISIDIPDSITSLGANAFYSNLLTSVSLGSGLTEIKGGTFAKNRITEIILPPGITKIGDGAFQTNAITKITIGQNVTITKTTSLGNYGGAFNTFYTNEGLAAGTYVYEKGSWRRQ